MLRQTLVAFVLLLPPTAAIADPIDDIFKRQMARSGIPEAAIAVIENGQVRKLQGYGKAALEWNASVSPDTPFQLASGTKIFTGVLLMRLVERGDIRLDDSIGRYFEGSPAEWQSITVRNLIHYTSGLPPIPGMAGGKTSEEVIAEAMLAPLAYPTGSASQYILTNIIVLKALLEKATGLSYEALLEREVVKPLGLKSTRYNQMVNEPGSIMRNSEPIDGRAVVYGSREEKLIVREAAYNPASYAGGGLFSSAADFSKLFQAIDNGDFLSDKSRKELVTPPVLNGGQLGGWGVGWTVRSYRGNKLAGHTGGPALSDIVRLPDRNLTVVALTNYHNFYPMPAEAILATRIPQLKGTATVTDSAPQLTAILVSALASAKTGSIETKGFSEFFKAGLASYWNGFGQSYLTAMGPVIGVRLVAEEKRGANLVRNY